MSIAKEKRNQIIFGNRGFTVVELLIAFSVFAILALAVTPVFKQGSDFWQAAESEVELRQSLNAALETVSGEIRQADAGSISTGADQAVSYTAAGQTRSFDLAPNPGKAQERHIVFYDGTVVTPSSRVNVLDFTVTPDGAGYRVSITGQYTGPNSIKSDYEKLTVTTRVFPRSEL